METWFDLCVEDGEKKINMSVWSSAFPTKKNTICKFQKYFDFFFYPLH